MPAFESRIDTGSHRFLQNRADMFAATDRVRALERTVRDLSASQKSKFEKRGQILPRERMALLLDPGAPVLEFSTLAGFELNDDNGKDQILGGCVITGIGYVSGVLCVFNISDSAIKGG